MPFREKLKILLRGEQKQDVAARAGISPQVLSNMLARTTPPRSDVALGLARALSVPLDWLVDDEADFPPPEQPGKRIEDINNDDLLAELTRRAFLSLQDCITRFRKVQEVDWVEVARRVYALPLDEIDGELEGALELVRQYHRATSDLDMFLNPKMFLNAGVGGAIKGIKDQGGEPPAEFTKWDDWLEQAEEWCDRSVAFRAVSNIESLRMTYMLPSMRDAAETQRVSKLRDLERMHLAQPAPDLKAASVKKKR